MIKSRGRVSDHMTTLLTVTSLAIVVVLLVAFGPATGGESSAAQNSNSPRRPATPRRPLPKPPSGPRGFEKYAGKDSSSRLIAAGATRETVNPRRPVAPLEGRAYDARPFFAWEINPGSKTYHFELFQGDREKDPGSKVIYETDVAATEFGYPATAPVLKPGTLYSWRVSTPTLQALEHGVIARFIILSGNEAAEVQRALASAGLTSPKSSEDRLDQARVFENYGIWYDAFAIASDLAQNPNDKEALAYFEALLAKLENTPQ